MLFIKKNGKVLHLFWPVVLNVLVETFSKTFFAIHAVGIYAKSCR